MKILVVGDLMLDVHEEGSVERISPEAPIPILKNPISRYSLGGAANTAANIKNLGSNVVLVGRIGNDVDGKTICTLADQHGIEFRPIVLANSKTIAKRRFLSNGHQILRVDVEDVDTSGEAGFEAIRDLDFREISCIVISDYVKGFVDEKIARELIDRGAKQQIPVVVDTKRKNYELYKGAHLLTPNQAEATLATGEEKPELSSALISKITGGSALVTLGADGMILHENGVHFRVPSYAGEVVDVTGAGDTVTAAMAIKIAHKLDLKEAMEFASRAAAIAISRIGTYPVKISDL